VQAKSVCTLRQLGKAMINATIKGYETPVLEVPDILHLSNR
jgi:hypothetical protein